LDIRWLTTREFGDGRPGLDGWEVPPLRRLRGTDLHDRRERTTIAKMTHLRMTKMRDQGATG
jgi:hypothetical protein